IVSGYCLYYAPYGINETDGGFLTGLAWQVLNGKVLYQDIIYVRPPLPVWLRAMELQILPEQFAILGERWFFYLKVALYSWMGAVVIMGDSNRRWQLAVLAFVVSAHCYPPMAWHTVDGILFSVMAVFFAVKGGKTIGLSGVCLCCALLCKQSFYPLLPLFALFLFLENENRWRKMLWFFAAFSVCIILFVSYLKQENVLSGFIKMTSSAASGGQALEHGILDYFRITPELALPSIILLVPVVWWFWKGGNPKIARMAWFFWLSALVVSYGLITWLRQDHTVPFAQTRSMFWLAAGFFLASRSRFTVHRSSLLLLGISWCAAVSWGYNLPILFAVPWVWAGMEVTRVLEEASKPVRFLKPYRFAFLILLLLSFRIGHEFVYRDGRRSAMNQPMGAIFPQLSGIYSDAESAELYRDLKQLAERFGENFKTLPAFPQANFLTQTFPPLPLDWVVNRETNGDNNLVIKDLKGRRPVIFIQKSFREKIESDPELELTRKILQSGKILEETPHFWVLGSYLE
ncbi:MAG: hypothetical protein ACKVT2_09920, partial [Saprospiraceae bacterium]